jgi:hypothetical protein
MLIKVHKPSLNEVGLTNKDKSLEKHKCKIKSKLIRPSTGSSYLWRLK